MMCYLSAFLIGVVCAKEGMLTVEFGADVVNVKVILEGLKVNETKQTNVRHNSKSNV